MLEIQGNRTLSGAWGELWIDGEKIMEMSKISLKVTANREDVQLGLSVDSKITGLKGEGSYTVKKVYTRAKAILEKWKKGQDVRCQIIAKLGERRDRGRRGHDRISADGHAESGRDQIGGGHGERKRRCIQGIYPESHETAEGEKSTEI